MELRELLDAPVDQTVRRESAGFVLQHSRHAEVRDVSGADGEPRCTRPVGLSTFLATLTVELPSTDANGRLEREQLEVAFEARVFVAHVGAEDGHENAIARIAERAGE